jgi:hypothetical protein
VIRNSDAINSLSTSACGQPWFSRHHSSVRDRKTGYALARAKSPVFSLAERKKGAVFA